MKSQRQGVRSTQEKVESEEEDVPAEQKKRHSNIAVKIWDVKEKIFTDQTRKFPYQVVPFAFCIPFGPNLDICCCLVTQDVHFGIEDSGGLYSLQ